MITLICGTGGSGKSYLVEQVITRLNQQFGEALGHLTLKRARDGIGGYYWPGRAVIGRYTDVLNGGCDNFSWPKAPEDLEALVIERAQAGQHVLLEGLTTGAWGVDRLRRIQEHGHLLCIHLNTPVEECIAGINARKEFLRSYGLDPKPLNEKATRSKHHTLYTVMDLRRKSGIPLLWLSRDEALRRTLIRMDVT